MPDHPTNPAIQLLDGNFYAAGPHPAFTWMRAHAPVYWDAEGNVWGVALHEDVLEVSRQPDLFCSGQSSRPDSPPIPSMMLIGDLLGVEPEDRLMLQRWSDELIAGTSMTATPEAMASAARAFGEYAQYNRRVVADRRRRGPPKHRDGPRDDLMSVLVDPIRTATRDTVLRGQQIRTGDKVLLLYPSANRDERVFADPFRFDSARDPNPHLAFGFGAHFCLAPASRASKWSSRRVSGAAHGSA